MNRTPAGRTSGHIVGALSLAIMIAGSSLQFHDWLHIYNRWAPAIITALLAVGGSIYAARKASRWWYALTVFSSLFVILYIVALGG